MSEDNLEELIEAFKILDNKLSEGDLTEEDEDRWIALKHKIEQATAPSSPLSSRNAPLVAPVDLEVTFEDARGFNRCYLRHISEGGVYIEKVIEMGKRLRIRIVIDDPPTSLEIEVQVVWVNEEPSEDSGLKPGVGVAWLDLPRNKKAVIKSIVHRALDDIAKASKS